MNINESYNKILKSKEYRDFMEQNKSAYLCSCFFMLDKENNSQEIHFDYYIGSEKKMFSFKINSEITLVLLEVFDKRIQEKLNLNKNIELENFEKLIVERMEKENIRESIKKFLYSFQCVKGKNLLLVTVFLSKLALLKVSIDISNIEIMDFEKKSFFDMVNIFRKK